MLPLSGGRAVNQKGSALRFLFSGGGTGGGVYPALAVIDALQETDPATEVLWIGSTTGVEKDLVARAGLPFRGVSGGPIVGVGLRAIPNAIRLLAGTAQALRIAREFRPDAALITGGWATIPAALAARLAGVPLSIYLPDVEPASAVRALSRLATRVMVTAEDSPSFFRPGQAVHTGYPIRAELLKAAGFDALGNPLGEAPASAQAARKRFSLAEELPTLLVFGGSRGARSINRALVPQLSDLLPACQIIHITGSLDWPEIEASLPELRESLPGPIATRYHPYAYLHSEDMALALTAADLVVSRAGASTLGEFPLFGLPAILVPYPFAWRYQKTNADYLASRGAAMRLDDDMLSSQLTPTVRPLLTDAGRRQVMAESALALRHPDAAARVAALLTDLATHRGGPR